MKIHVSVVVVLKELNVMSVVEMAKLIVVIVVVKER
jgi:hypothetical protein